MFIAKDLNQFKSLFVNRLKNMLSDDELGAFILVLANSLQDEFLKKELAEDLQNNFLALKKKLQANELTATQDDLDVFQQLLDTDIGQLPVWKSRTAGQWEIVYNVMRELRPARASSQVLDSIIQVFDETKFHFNKPFLKPEILWQGEYQHKKVRVLYNKFPFSDYHLLIVVSPELNSAQVLQQEMHRYIFELTAEVSDTLPGFGIGFNSLAAGASVNHLHFQGFIREQFFPVETVDELNDYPVTVKRFSDVESSWSYIQELTEQDAAFNCLYRKESCYVLPRKYQGTAELPDWLNGAGWLDVAGVMTLSDEQMFDALDETSIAPALSLLR
jgi:hypothetical protein